MRLIGRLFILFAAFAVIAWGVWTYALGRPDMQRQFFARAAESRFEKAQPRPADAQTFRATVCETGPCLLVEAGGLAFLVGAGRGAADGLAAHGLVRRDLDAVLLATTKVESTEGLADLTRSLRAAGRQEPLVVHGPAGAEQAVQGANLILVASGDAPAPPPPPASPRAPQPPPAPQPLVVGQVIASEGPSSVVFDSGVVAVNAFAAAEGGERIYRFDFDGRSLIVAGCAARSADILAAARGATQAAVVIPAASGWMLETDRNAATATGAARLDKGGGCLTPEDAITAMRDARLTGGLLAPLYPASDDQAASRLWREFVASPAGLTVAPGEPGMTLELLKEGPAISRAGERAAAKPKPGSEPKPKPEKQAGP